MIFTLPQDLSLEDQAGEIAAFAADLGLFIPSEPLWLARAPGRLDVIGGNVDYTGGMVLQGLLREAVWVAVQPRNDSIIHVLNPGAVQFGWEPNLELSSTDLDSPAGLRLLCNQRESTRWGCYVLGALCFLHKFHCPSVTTGANLFITSNLPPNKGVSSSAALTIATLKAASAAKGVHLSGVDLATAGQWVENVAVGSACGIMDHAAIVLGRENHLLPMLCQPCLPFPPVGFPDGLRIWGIDSMAARSTTSAVYETARAAAFIGYRLICQREGIEMKAEEQSGIPRWTDSRWKGYLSDLSPDEFSEKYEHWLPESLSGRDFLAHATEHVDPFTQIDPAAEYPVRAAVRYATEENVRVRRARSLLESAARSASYGILQLLGEILCQSHAAYAECGLGSEACDDLVERALRSGLPGAKMTGGGGGGVVAVLGTPNDEETIYRIAEKYGSQRGAMPHIFKGSSPGADAFDVRSLHLRSLRNIRN